MWSDGNYMQAPQPLNRCIKFFHIHLQSKTLDLIQSAATSWRTLLPIQTRRLFSFQEYCSICLEVNVHTTLLA